MSSDNDPPEPEIKEVVVYETKEVEVEVEVPILPESCALAIERAIKINEMAAAMSATGAQQVDLLTEVNKSIASDDMQVHNEAIQQQRDLIDSSAEWLVPMSYDNSQLEAFFETCREDIE